MGVNIRNSEGYMDTVPFQALSGIDHEAKAASKPAFRPLVYICAPFSGEGCQEVWVLNERITRGMSIESEKAKKRRQTVRYFNSRYEEVQA